MSSSNEDKQLASMKLREIISKFEAEHGSTIALATLGIAAVKIVRSNNMNKINMDLGEGGGTMVVTGYENINETESEEGWSSEADQDLKIPENRTLH